MTKRSSLKRSLVLSLTSLILCVAMLLGTTFAWFSETITSEINTIKSGNLDVELEYYTEGGWKKVSGATDIFDPNALWEPGYTEVVYLKITNLGSLAIKYNLGINISSETEGTNAEGNKFKLSDYIKFGAQDVTAVDAYADREAAVAAVDATATVLSTPYSASGTMEKQNDERIIAVVLYMPTSVGNEANHNGEDLPKIELGVSLFATQMASEEDSFDNTYDEDAAWTGLADTSWYFADPTATEFTISTPEALAGLAALVNGEAVEPSAALESTTAKVQESFKGKVIYLDDDINLNNLSWTPIGKTFNKYEFGGTFDGQDHTISNFKVDNKAGSALFGFVRYSGAKTLPSVKNVTVENVVATGGDYVAGVVGQLYGTVENCHAINVTAIATPFLLSDGKTYDGGAKAGGVIGWIESGSIYSATGCTATKVTVQAYRDLGGVIGMAHNNNVITDCKVDGAKLGYVLLEPDEAYADDKVNENIGGVIGRRGSNVVESGSSESNVEIVIAVNSARGLINAMSKGGNIVLVADIPFNNDTFVTVPAGVSATVDLAGHKVTGTGTLGQATYLINNKGTLVINDSKGGGSVELLNAVVSSDNSYATDVIFNNADLTINGGSFINNLRGASYALDNNSGATAVINGGKLINESASGTAVRAYGHSATSESSVTINGGEIEGPYAIRIQNLSSTVASKITVNVNGGTITSNGHGEYLMALYSFCNDGTNVTVNVEGGTFYGDIAFGGGNKAGMETVNVDTTKATVYGKVYSYNDGASVDIETDCISVRTADQFRYAVKNGYDVLLLNDLELDADETVTFATGSKISVDLGGYTISSVADGTTGNRELFLIKGVATFMNGTVKLLATVNQGWNAMSTVFDVTAGGVLNIENATVENLGGTDMNFCVHLNNWGEVTLNVKDSTLKATYIGVRAFNSGYDDNNITIVGSTIETGSYCFWVHNYIGDLDSTLHPNDAINARLNLDIYGDGNTYKTSKAAPVLFGFNHYVYFNAEGKEVVVSLDGLKAKLDSAAAGTTVITLAVDIVGDVTVVQKPDVKIVIDGAGHKYTGVITVDGKSARYETAALTIQNFNFDVESKEALGGPDAFIRLGHVNDARYTDNVTVKDCTFTSSGEGVVAVKSYTGGDHNLVLEGLTVNAGMHSLAQLKNVEKGLKIEDCKVYSKNGVNLNNSCYMDMVGCTFEVQGYAVRFGADNPVFDEVFTIKDSTLKSACAEAGDAVLEFRGGAVSSTLTLINTTLEGTPETKGTTADTVIVEQ